MPKLVFTNSTGQRTEHNLSGAFRIGKGGDFSVPQARNSELCRIVRVAGQWQVEELGAGQTYVNGVVLKLGHPHKLSDGDLIQIGGDKSPWVVALYGDPAQPSLQASPPPLPVALPLQRPPSAADPTELERLRSERAALSDEVRRLTALAETSSIDASASLRSANRRYDDLLYELTDLKRVHAELLTVHGNLAKDFIARQERAVQMEIQMDANERRTNKAVDDAETWEAKARQLEAELKVALLSRQEDRAEVERLRLALENKANENNELRAIITAQQGR